MIVIIIGLIITILTAIPVFIQMRHHPRGLVICFMAEMWERFSYYGMRALLIYYVTTHFLFPDARANEQYSSYTTLVYLLPLVGGVLADRYLGTRKAIIFGALLLVAGHFSMAFEGKPNQQTLEYKGQTYEFVKNEADKSSTRKLIQIGDKQFEYKAGGEGAIEIVGLPSDAPLPAKIEKSEYKLGVKSSTPWAEKVFYLAISLIIMGVGFLKANISSIVGQLYKDKDPRRDAGFQLYYFGINLGAFWATILCGYLGQNVGWWAGFGLAGVGMLAGLLFFVLGQPLLEGKGMPPSPEKLKEKVLGVVSVEKFIYICAFIGLPVVWLLVQNNKAVGYGLGIGSLAVLVYVFYTMFTKLSREENFRLGLALLLTAGSVVFFTLFEQAGSSLSLFAERNTNLNILPSPITIALMGKQFVFASAEQFKALQGLVNPVWIDTEITAAQTQSFNAGFILIFAPIFSAIFTYLGTHRIDPDPVKKFSFGLLNVGFGFLILVWFAGSADSAFKMPLIFLFLTYLFHTWGELALSPVGLSQQTKLSPPFLISTMMAIWFLGSAAAQFVAGIIAKLAATETVGGEVLDPQAALQTSLKTFNLIGWWGIGIGVGFFILSFFVRKWDFGANDTTSE